MPVSSSHGKRRPENFRSNKLPTFDPAEVAVPDRDPKTGRFAPGNSTSRRRKLIRVARSLPWLDESACEPWLAPYVVAAKQHAVDLLDSLPPGGALLSPLAEELATARVIVRALLAKGMQGDAKALEDARAWFREARQHALALEGMARRPIEPDREREDIHRAVEKAFGEPTGGDQ